MRKFRNLGLAVVCAGALLGSVGSASASVLFFDDFDADTPALGNATALVNWDVTAGSVDVIPLAGGQYDFYPGNGRYIDLDGTTNVAGQITTKDSFNLVAGKQYRLEFDYGLNPGGNGSSETIQYEVSLGNLAASLLINSPVSALQHFSTVFTGNGSTAKLIIAALGGDNQGPILDNVRLSAVPIPPALPLFGAGLLALGYLGRRRKFRKTTEA